MKHPENKEFPFVDSKHPGGMYRYCPYCRKWKPLVTCFYLFEKRYYRRCKKCQNKATGKWQKEHLDEVLLFQKKRRLDGKGKRKKKENDA